MVLRKQRPPRLDDFAQGKGRSGLLPSAFPTAPVTKPASPVSPKRLTRPRRARSTPQPYQNPPHDPVYSPDLNTSPAFDLMPIEQAQRTPPGSSHGDHQNPWIDDWVNIPSLGQGHSDMGPTSAPHNGTQGTLPDDGTGGRVPPIEGPGTQQRIGTNDWQQTPASNDASEWPKSNQPVQLQSNNPFLRATQSDPDPWGNSQGQDLDGGNGHDLRTTSFFQSDGSDQSSQNEGFIPMTARISLLDQQGSESPWVEQRSTTSLQPIDMNKPQPSDQEREPRTSPNSTVAQVPMGIYLGSGVDYQQGDQRVPAVTFEPSEPTSHHDRFRYPQQYDQQLDSGTLGSEHGANSPSTLLSNASTDSSHELIEVDSCTNEDADTKDILDSKAIPQSEASAGGVPAAQLASPINSTTGPTPEQGTSKPTPSPAVSEADAKRGREQRSETYSIRHVNWTDTTGKLRQSPVLVQNKNGPCPLLALVNALVLRAGKGAQPPIVKALQNKEQISLGLLIEAMFDELTTCLGPDQPLPDIEALSRFLTMLHTGMNVNPRLTLESDDAVGSFLQTGDLRLYGTFGVPLVHGWVAPPSSQAHESLTRVGQYHEDIQLLHFRKQELEDRVFRGGTLSPQEEQVMSDIQLVQQFVDVDNATQLSAFGLDRLAEMLAPGSVSILFRNDHFSTLYKHPESNQLFTMVTDAGYSGHAEVVWESQVDISGSRTGFFSGDFRPVGHSSTEDSGLAGPRGSSSGATRSDAPEEPLKTRMSPQEQSDADYAYALQLQFDEEQRNQREHNRRASAPPQSQADGPNNRGVRGSTADRRTQRASHLSRPRHTNDNSEDGPPPPYAQAAGSPAYSPPQEMSQFTDFSQEDRYLRNPYQRRAGAPVSAVPDRSRDRSSRDCAVM